MLPFYEWKDKFIKENGFKYNEYGRVDKEYYYSKYGDYCKKERLKLKMHNDPNDHEHPEEVFPVKDWDKINWNRWNHTVLEGE